MTEDVRAFLRRWHAEGRPDDWHVAPVLADAAEEGGMDDAVKLAAMRAGRMRSEVTTKSGYRYSLPVFDDEDIAVAHGMPEQLRGYEWQQAFGYAGEPDTHAGANTPSPALPGDPVGCSPFGRKDVAEVVALSEGENDGPNWLCVGRLNDGRWFALDAGCDYTGWD